MPILKTKDLAHEYVQVRSNKRLKRKVAQTNNLRTLPKVWVHRVSE